MSITPSQPVESDFEGSAFDEWIAGATVSKRSVPIYGKPGLFAEYEELERRAERLSAESDENGSELGGSELAKVEARMREIHEEYEESRSTWIVHALPPDARDTAMAHEPALVEPEPPTAPAPLPDRATQEHRRVHSQATERYREAVKVYDREFGKFTEELNLRLIVAGVECIRFSDGREVDGVTVDQLRAMQDTLGERQVLSLLAGIHLAGMEEPEIPAPFSRSSSESEPTS